MEYIKQLIDTSQSMEKNIIELIQSTDDVLSLAGLIEHRLSIQATLSAGDWILSIGQWDKPSLVVYECNNNPCFDNIESYIRECKQGLGRLKDEAKVEGDSFAKALQNILIEDVETETFYSAITVEKGETVQRGVGYFDKRDMELSIINQANTIDYSGHTFDEYKNKHEAIKGIQLDMDEENPNDPFYKNIIKKIEEHDQDERIIVIVEHDNVTIKPYTECCEFEWAWSVITHDLQEYGYITLAEK